MEGEKMPKIGETGDKKSVSRRSFLKILGATTAAGAVGCAGDKGQKVLPYVKPEDGLIPGEPAWYSSTCTECSAGCGIRVMTVNGRAVKVEGNKESPVNRGSLCGLGQASLQNLYDPDRVRQPLKRELDKNNKPRFVPISWEEAYQSVSEALQSQSNPGAFVTNKNSGALEALQGSWTDTFESEKVVYDYELHSTLVDAAEVVYGVRGLPQYRFEKADAIVNFGADFLETWLSPCEFARGWAAGRKSDDPAKFIHIEPRLSLTGANADKWVSIAPGSEMALAFGLLRAAVKSGKKPRGLSAGAAFSQLSTLVERYTPEYVAESTGVAKETQKTILDTLINAKRPLVLSGGPSCSNPQSFATHVAVNLLNVVLGGVNRTVFPAQKSVEKMSPDSLTNLVKRLQDKKVGVLFLTGGNPSFSLPSSLGFDYAVRKASKVVALKSHLDETAWLADYILPVNTGLESWGDLELDNGSYSIQQPVMAPVFDTHEIGDILIKLAKLSGKKIPAIEESESFVDFVKSRWSKRSGDTVGTLAFEESWVKMVETGGRFTTERPEKVKPALNSKIFELDYELPTFSVEGATDSDLVVYPYMSVKTFDGRAANRPWLQELPDPMTNVVWDSWAELHPDTAKAKGIEQGDVVIVRNYFGEVSVPAYVTKHIHPGIVAIPVGQGHKAFGRYAQSVPQGNVYELLPPTAADKWTLVSTRADVTRGRGKHSLVVTSGSDDQEGRGLARTTFIGPEEKHGADEHHGSHHEPKQMYEQREHPVYRWGMSVDLNSCTGCSACVVACYAENNIPVVGKDLCGKGREMSWLRIERYVETGPSEELSVSFLPMMCQHCNNAPCEPVCPVYATYHNEEGLNAMVYNRCVGTRYCSNNCSYKVRRFNWVDIEFPEPLQMQLNPYVTKRTMGIMEKCTFCVQRISAGKDIAKDQGRLVEDGDIQPACVQSCPTNALAFGNLNDPNSRVSKLQKDKRTYKILDHHINTQPAVGYMERVKHSLA
jgi:anaerobic selenocysteine-containing dehydrogenase/Fe-S-cluster-containing dehydrogenase component